MNQNERIIALREGGQTMRCHTMRYVGHYDVAVHSYNALTLLLALYPGDPSVNLIKAVQWHDVPERWTGDVPTPAKMADHVFSAFLKGLEAKVLNKLGLKEIFLGLTGIELEWLNAVDILELYMWVMEQQAMGNLTTIPMQKQIHKIMEDKKRSIPKEAWEFYESFIWSRSVECHELIGDDDERK